MPIDNKKVQNQPLPQVLPKHPHRVLYILLFTLIFVLVAGAMVMYQINKVSIVEYSSPPTNTQNVDLQVLQTLKTRSVPEPSEADTMKILKALSVKSKVNKN